MKKNLYANKIHGFLKFIALSAMMFFLCGNNAFAQTTQVVKGKITDAATNESVPGATVLVKGTSTAVTSDANGGYAITITAPATLVFKFLGYTTQEVPITNQTVLNIKFVESAQELGEVKITTALGISKERRALGYSVSTVKGASLTEARTNSFVNGLEGKIAGVNVSGVATAQIVPPTWLYVASPV